MFDKTFELPLTRDYVRHWGVVEGVRELIQNALDSDSPFEYEWSENKDGISLRITSTYGKLDTKTLLLGSTSKADAKDKIGSFGEGYKIALLVLTRENRPTTVYNNGVTWHPEFFHSRQFESEMLRIVEKKDHSGRGKGLSFVVTGLTDQEKENITHMCLNMQRSLGEVIETSKGQILYDRPGKLYVNGLFVCDITEFTHGYNVKPEYLKLERDRQTVSSFDIKWISKEMWFESERNDEIVKMMDEDIPDMHYANYGTPEVVKEACYEHFMNNYKGQIIADDSKELKALVKEGMKVYVGGGSYGSTVSSNPNYTTKKIALKTPTTSLKEWLSSNRGNMRTPAIVAFKELITESESWKKSNE